MSTTLLICSTMFASWSIWLAVRIYNRRECWAKRTLAGTIFGTPVLYLVTFAPACWISARVQPSGEFVSLLYGPVIHEWTTGPTAIQKIITAYVDFGMNGIPYGALSGDYPRVQFFVRE
jgi:hypothetical protein